MRLMQCVPVVGLGVWRGSGLAARTLSRRPSGRPRRIIQGGRQVHLQLQHATRRPWPTYVDMSTEERNNYLEVWDDIPVMVYCITEYDVEKGKAHIMPYKIKKLPLDYMTE